MYLSKVQHCSQLGWCVLSWQCADLLIRQAWVLFSARSQTEVFLADWTSKDTGGLSDRRWVNECGSSPASAFFYHRSVRQRQSGNKVSPVRYRWSRISPNRFCPAMSTGINSLNYRKWTCDILFFSLVNFTSDEQHQCEVISTHAITIEICKKGQYLEKISAFKDLLNSIGTCYVYNVGFEHFRLISKQTNFLVDLSLFTNSEHPYWNLLQINLSVIGYWKKSLLEPAGQASLLGYYPTLVLYCISAGYGMETRDNRIYCTVLILGWLPGKSEEKGESTNLPKLAFLTAFFQKCSPEPYDFGPPRSVIICKYPDPHPSINEQKNLKILDFYQCCKSEICDILAQIRTGSTTDP